jgi:HK97 family phage prohead protease|nr:MAG TPA: prohead protease [Caudoviricetes sp.]
MNKITKLFNNQRMRSFDEKTRTVEFIISDNTTDRYGDIVNQDWDLKNYWNNPVLLWGHDPSQIDNVLGKCLEINTQEEDDRMLTTAKFQLAEAGTSKGVDTVFKLIQQGILRTVSVGFISHEIAQAENQKGETQNILKGNELLEVSVVPIPANPNAIALSYEDGSLNDKDIKFMEKSLENALTLVKKSVYDKIEISKNSKTQSQKKEFQMTDEDAKKIVEALMAELSPILSELKPKEDDKPEEDKKPKAKSKQNDDDGAFDENEELNEEQEKAFREELEKEYQKQLTK